ncbi:hypothetical protein GCM10010377_70400 [Streptomyces viridiviolaceus]|nr:hypothetical protein GCM10010377_70400 [Streptomyces viridiviolaceus]
MRRSVLAARKVEQVSHGAVQLDAVEIRLDRTLSGARELNHDALDLGGGQGARRDVVLGTLQREDLPVGADGGRSDRSETVDAGVAHSPRVLELEEHAPADGVHGVRHRAPPGRLLAGVDTGGHGVALSVERRLGALSQDQARQGLGVAMLDVGTPFRSARLRVVGASLCGWTVGDCRNEWVKRGIRNFSFVPGGRKCTAARVCGGVAAEKADRHIVGRPSVSAIGTRDGVPPCRAPSEGSRRRRLQQPQDIVCDAEYLPSR